jgi:hypothetical protein
MRFWSLGTVLMLSACTAKATPEAGSVAEGQAPPAVSVAPVRAEP